MYAAAPSIEALRPTWRARVYLTALILAFLATIGFAISAIGSNTLTASYNSATVSNGSIQLEPGATATIDIFSSPSLAAGAVVTSYSNTTSVATIDSTYDFADNSGSVSFVVTAVDSGNSTLTFATAGWGSVTVDIWVGWPVTYNLNGGSGDTPPDQYYYANDVGTTIANDSGFSRTGYTFLGWGDSSSDTSSEYSSGGSYSTAADLALFAIWSADTYTLTFDIDNGTGTTPSSISFDVNNSATLPDGTGFSRDGYTFEGWSTTSGTSTGEYSSGGSYSTLGDQTLYAAWSEDTYYVNYYANGGTGTDYDESFSVSSGFPTIDSNTFTREGYTFLGWSSNSSDVTGDVSYEPSDSYSTYADLSLYAIWSIDTYTLTFNIDNGTGTTPSSISFDVNNSATLPDGTGFSRDGYTFEGWSTTSGTSTGEYSSGGSYSTLGDQTLYAAWDAIDYTIYYYGNGSDGGTDPSSGTYTPGSGSYTISDVGSLTKTGATFLGWSTTSGDVSGDPTYAPGLSYDTTADLYLYAIWQDISYTISYDVNGGSGMLPTGGNFTYCDVNVGSASGLTYSGYTFSHWNTESNDTGTSYDEADALCETQNTTLYAIWTANSYDVLYYGNGADGGVSNNGSYVTGGPAYLIESSTWTYTGYTFLGWSTNSSDVTGDASYDVGTSYDTAADLNLYAIWSLNNYNITYDGNTNTGGSAPGGVSFDVLDGTYTIEGEGSLVKDGYTFMGWSTNSSDTSAEYVSGDSYDTLADLTLYAIWGGASYDIFYNANGATSGTHFDGVYTVGAGAYTIGANGFVYPGYSFVGWSTNSGDVTGDASYDVGDSYDTAADLYLFAIWSLDNYNIIYDGNGNTGGTAPNGSSFDVLDGTYIIQGPGNLAKDGLNFLGWSTNSSDTTAEYVSGDSYDTLADLTLYAIWQGADYDITYNGNGSNGGSTSAGTYSAGGSAYSIAANGFIRTGYTFVGWEDISGDSYDVGESYDTAADLVLYAQWQPNVYEVNYYRNGGTGTVPSVRSFIYEQTDVTISGTSLTREGYEFAGWNTEANGSGDNYIVGSTYDDPADLELYAQWDEVTDGGGGETEIEPPVITSNPVVCSPTGVVTFTGLRLNGLLSLQAGGKTLQILNQTATSITVRAPFDLLPNLYDVKGYYEGGSILTKNSLLIEVDLAVWTKRISTSQAKMYAKWPVLEGKIQFKVNGKETAWIRAVDYSDPKLFTAEGVGYYLVRTVDLAPGKNALEIYQDGVRIWRASYWR